MNPFKNFITGLLLFSAIIAVLFYFIEPFFTGKSAFPEFWIIQLIMIAATVLFHYGLMRAVKSGGQVIDGGIVSLTVIVWVQLLVFPHESAA